MSTERTTNKKLATWLDSLQQDSWQLELIISGFTIFLLMQALEPTKDWLAYLYYSNAGGASFGPVMVIFGFILYSILAITTFNLILHLLMRSIWISAIGLRSVSGDIEYENLKVAPIFKNYLIKRVGSFDVFIDKLEKICSMVFAFAFMLIFMFISVGLVFFFLALFTSVTDYFNMPSWLRIVSITVLSLSLLIYFLDFVTLGFLKKNKYFAYIYFPFYWFWSTITLSFLYRPIYYNIITNKYARKIGYALVPYVIIVSSVDYLFEINGYDYFYPNESSYHLTSSYYDSLRDMDNPTQKITASIPQQVVYNNTLELFVEYRPSSDNAIIKQVCETLPSQSGALDQFKKGFNQGAHGEGKDIQQLLNNNTIEAEQYLDCMSQLYQVYLNDSLLQNLDFLFYQHPQVGNKGLFTVVDLSHLKKGKHHLTIKKQRFLERKCEDLIWVDKAVIPFFKQ